MNATKNAPNMVEQIIDPSLDAYPNWKAWAIWASDLMAKESRGTSLQTKIVWKCNPAYTNERSFGEPVTVEFSDTLGNEHDVNFTDSELQIGSKYEYNVLRLWGNWLGIRSRDAIRRLIDKMKLEEAQSL